MLLFLSSSVFSFLKIFSIIKTIRTPADEWAYFAHHLSEFDS